MRHFCLEKNRVAMGGPWAGAALRDGICNRQSWRSVTKPLVFVYWGKKLVIPFQKPYLEQVRNEK